MKRRTKEVRAVLVSFIFLLIFSPISLFAATYYVATNGNNSNPGTIGSPWRTITYGIGHSGAGDTLYIRGGAYGPNEAVPETSAVWPQTFCGSAKWGLSNVYNQYDGRCGNADGTWRIISAYPTGGTGPGYESVIINDMGLTTITSDVSNHYSDTGCPYVKVIGLNFHGTGPNNGCVGPSLGMAGQHIEFTNLLIDGYITKYFGAINITSGGHDYLVKNIVMNLSPKAADGGNFHGIYLRQGGYPLGNPAGSADTYNVGITGNTIKGISGWGVHVHYDNESTLYAAPHHVLIEKNTFTDIDRAGILFAMSNSGPAHDFVIRNNVFYNIKWAAMQFSTSGGANGNSYNIDFYNNTIYNCTTTPASENYGGVYFQNLTTAGDGDVYNVTVKNNIIWRSSNSYAYSVYNENTGYPTSRIYDVTLSNNLTWPDNTNTLNGMTMSNTVTGNPQFNNIGGNNFSILSSSSAIDHGVTVTAPSWVASMPGWVSNSEDFLGKTRTGIWDIGAYEYGGSSSLKPPTGLSIVTGP